ncbi:MAG: hypothetical protein MSA77_01865 [Selenomonadales bacterium]|nr:hypothetical protein [Selenomonadales bacterium]
MIEGVIISSKGIGIASLEVHHTENSRTLSNIRKCNHWPQHGTAEGLSILSYYLKGRLILFHVHLL